MQGYRQLGNLHSVLKVLKGIVNFEAQNFELQTFSGKIKKIDHFPSTSLLSGDDDDSFKLHRWSHV